MAQDYTGLLMVAGIAGLGWYAYEQGWLSGLIPAAVPPTQTPAPVITTPLSTGPALSCVLPNVLVGNACVAPPPVQTPAPQSTPQTLAALLTSAAGSSAQSGLTPDQWSYYYATLTGRTAIPPDTFATMLSKSGVVRSNPMSADYFVGMLNSAGLSGLGSYSGVPVGAIHGGW